MKFPPTTRSPSNSARAFTVPFTPPPIDSQSEPDHLARFETGTLPATEKSPPAIRPPAQGSDASTCTGAWPPRPFPAGGGPNSLDQAPPLRALCGTTAMHTLTRPSIRHTATELNEMCREHMLNLPSRACDVSFCD